MGLDSAQLATAVNQMQAHIDQGSTYEWEHSAYLDPNGTEPGTGGNCSSTASNCVVTAGENNPSEAPASGDQGSGVLNIEANTNAITNNDYIEAGNLITFRVGGGGYQYHTGLVLGVERQDGTTTITFGHNSSTAGAASETFTIGDGSTWDNRTHGFYWWDNTPNLVNAGIQPSTTIVGSGPTYIQPIPATTLTPR